MRSCWKRFLFVVVFLTFFIYIHSEPTTFEIYKTNNNYPRPLLLHDGTVLAFSGKNNGYFSKYSSNAEPIFKERPLNFNYSENADIKQLQGDDKRYVLASGKSTEIKLYIFDDDANYYITEWKDLWSYGFKMNILPLSSGGIVLGWSSADNKGNVVRLELKGNTFSIIQDTHYTWNSDNWYISCIELENKNILCQYVSFKCKEEYFLFDLNLKKIDNQSFYQNGDCAFDKIIYLGNNNVAMCFINYIKLICIIKSYQESDNQLKNAVNENIPENKEIISNCQHKDAIIRTDTAYFDYNKFIGTCKNSDGKIQIAIVTINYQSQSWTKQLIVIDVVGDFPFATKFSDTFVAVFFHDADNNVFEILEYPNCTPYENSTKIFINKTLSDIKLSDLIIKGNGDVTGAELLLYIAKLPPSGSGDIKQADGTQINAGEVYSPSISIVYTASGVDGKISFVFAGSVANNNGKWCNYFIEVMPCYVPGCFTCSTNSGSDVDYKCESCKENNYPVEGIANSCVESKEFYYLNKDVENNYIFKPCFSNCASCSKSGDANKNNCTQCKAEYYLTQDDENGNCRKNPVIGYYLEDNVFKKCYESCEYCTGAGTSDSNNCTSCLTSGDYYPIENVDYECYDERSIPNGYYWDIESSSKVWKKCYETCETCSTGGSSSSHNCNTCLSPNKKVFNQPGQCVSTAPPNYYYNITEDQYKPCDQTCSQCESDEPFCLECQTNYYPWSTTSSPNWMCYQNGTHPDAFYFDSSVFKPCFQTCKTCQEGGTESQNNCDSCVETSAPLVDVDKSCVDKEQTPDHYYLEDNIFKKCDIACWSCKGKPSNETNCITCSESYIKVDQTSNCVENCPTGYYKENSVPPVCKKCYETCSSCSEKGDNDMNNCEVCADNYYKMENTNNCFENPLPGYYWDNSSKIFKKCYDNCSTCFGEGNDSDNNCDMCKNDYFKEKSTNNCFTYPKPGYYLKDNEFNRCFQNCATCEKGGDTETNNCSDCIDEYYKMINTDNCYGTKPDEHYLDKNENLYKKCYQNCDSCSMAGDDESHNCDDCKNKHYKIEGTNNCFENPPFYYLDDDQTYKKCHANCASCLKAGNDADNNCETCPANSYKIEGNDNCYDNQPPGYYLDRTDDLYKKCHDNCSTCSSSPIDDDNNCNECKTDFHKMETGNSCYYSPPGYYLDSDIYYKCHTNCATCSQKSVENNYNCETCPNDSYKINGTDNCEDINLEGYYLDDDNGEKTLKKCYENCAKCEGEGSESQNNCTQCKSGYSFIIDQIGQCHNSNIDWDDYYWDTNESMFKPCYSSCKTCDGAGTSESNNCKTCDDNYYPIEGKSDSCSELKEGYYLDSVTEAEDDFVIKKCYITCLSCSAGGNEENHNCNACLSEYIWNTVDGKIRCSSTVECNSDEYLLNGKCVKECPDYWIEYNNSICLNCKDQGKYHILGSIECFENIPDGYYFDPTENNGDNEWYNTLSQCDAHCKTCDEKDKCLSCIDYKTDENCTSCVESAKNCDLCKNNFIKESDFCYNQCPDSKFLLYISETINCVEQCSDYYISDTDKRMCVNCKNNEENVYKYINDNECVKEIPKNGVIIDRNTNTFDLCYSNCGTCESIGNSSYHWCTSCISPFYLIVGGTQCIDSCGGNYAKDESGRTCVNCKVENKYHYYGSDDCLDEQPTDAALVDGETNTYSKCYPTCATCSAASEDENNQNCISCIDSNYLQFDLASKEYTSNCISSCHKYEIAKDGKCVNCKYLETGEHFYWFESNDCSASLPEDGGYYLVDVDYNYYIPCKLGCKSCEWDTEKCHSCLDGYYLDVDYPSTKVCLYQTCGDWWFANSQTNKCVNCKLENDKYMYYEGNECLSDKPEGTYLDPTYSDRYNIIKNCSSKCGSCQMGETESTDNCDTCKEGNHYLTLDKNCVTSCGVNYGIDSTGTKCINCKDSTEDNQYKNINSNHIACETLPDNAFVVDNTYNLFDYCSSNCSKCSIISSSISVKCDQCAPNFYLDVTPNPDCLESCDSSHVSDTTNPNDMKCINCKTYKYPTEEYKLNNECVEHIPDGYYVSDDVNNVLSQCDSSCGTCQDASSCDTCLNENYFKIQEITSELCVETCEYFFYIDDSKGYHCTEKDSCSEVSDRKIADETNPWRKQCVKNCQSSFSHSYCINCQTTDWYEHQNKCLTECPANYVEDKTTHKCVPNSIDTTKCNERISTIRDTGLEALPNLLTDSLDQYLQWLSSTPSDKNVGVFAGSSYSIQIYQNDQCGYNSSIANEWTYINFTECAAKLSKANSWDIAEIIFVKIDFNRTNSTTNQIDYYAHSTNGNELSLNPCNEVTFEVSYPYIWDDNINSLARLMSGKGFDIFNPNDPFFNDFCTPFYDENGDVILLDRRANYFQNISFCEEGCNYTQVDFSSGRVSCQCSLKDNSIWSNENLIENTFFEDYSSLWNSNNLIVVRCYNLVFNLNYMKKNIGSWILLIFFLLQWPAVITFMCIGFKPIYAYLNQFCQEENNNNANNAVNANNNLQENNNGNKNNDLSDCDEISSQNISAANPPKKAGNQSIIKETEKWSNQEIIIDTNTPQPLIINKNSQNKKRLPMFDWGNKKNNNYVTQKSSSTTTNQLSLSSDCTNKDLKRNAHQKPTEKGKVYSEDGDDSKKSEKNRDTEIDEDDDGFESEELDELVYEDAVVYDPRGICHFLWKMMKMKVFVLVPFTDISVFEPFCVQFLGFILNLSIIVALNALLFDEQYISKRYNEDGSSGWLYVWEKELPKCIYASLACSFVGWAILCLTSVKKRFQMLINNNKIERFTFIAEAKCIINSLKWKIIFFLIINIILMCSFWYYISAFCAVYQETQFAWFQGCLFSLLFCIILQTMYALFITILRYIGLRCKISCMYSLSKCFL